jgi:hypothetical protein
MKELQDSSAAGSHVEVSTTGSWHNATLAQHTHEGAAGQQGGRQPASDQVKQWSSSAGQLVQLSGTHTTRESQGSRACAVSMHVALMLLALKKGAERGVSC